MSYEPITYDQLTREIISMKEDLAGIKTEFKAMNEMQEKDTDEEEETEMKKEATKTLILKAMDQTRQRFEQVTSE